ncbi:fungal-specific transcription factor domain-containing protein [Gymnopilus junonius]|uniref:Fungal-specific transcription factor domain-containing protein n=1 Tax=Gymnopilus junonius TaxID=109634 RepID=A0A9P5NRX2_GYMJU|nr:fungal-specific transcription factor domain-containing protein [Gymnopilus junonius]
MLSDHTSDSVRSRSLPDAQKTKKRRLHGACDACRKKKSDSAEMPGKICTNCRISNIQCSHDIPRQPKKSETQQTYIRRLEEKLAKMENYLQKTHPDQDIDHLIETTADDSAIQSPNDTVKAASPSYPDLKYPIPHSVSTDAASAVSTPPDTVDDQPESSDDGDDLAHVALAEHLSSLSIAAVDDRFFGQSSTFMFAKQVSNVKSEITGTPLRPDPSRFRRPLYWDLRPWEMAYALTPEPSYVFPEEELLQNLVALYFERMNPVLPVLHKPSFLKSISAGQHNWDASFGGTVLLVCAIGARYSQDTRVTVGNDPSGLSAGWQYFCQVPLHRKSMFYKSTIYDLQYYCLATVYLIGTSIPHVSWNFLGLGVRYALEKGAHRRKGHNQKVSPEDELLKRCFWCLICIDRLMSSFLGRPCAIHDEEFDIEYPIECDDEYWETENPENAFKQPAGKPCSITAFVCLIKLCEILSFALRTLYSTKKSKVLVGLIGHEWEHRIVAELDSSLNKWKDSLPDFLQWDPERADLQFFHQSVVLHCGYYYVQIQTHRPFLTKKSPLSFSSLAMCTNAARSCSHVVEASMTRGFWISPHLIIAAAAAGLVIVLNLLINQESGLAGDPVKEIGNLQKIMAFLRECEKRWHTSGRLVDMLTEIGSLQDYQPRSSGKRRPAPAPPPNFISVNSSYSAPAAVPATAVNTNPFPSSTAAAMPTNDWDLSNLLLIEMGYIQANAGQDTMQPVPAFGNPSLTAPQLFPTGQYAHITRTTPDSIPQSRTF